MDEYFFKELENLVKMEEIYVYIFVELIFKNIYEVKFNRII